MKEKFICTIAADNNMHNYKYIQAKYLNLTPLPKRKSVQHLASNNFILFSVVVVNIKELK